MVDFVQLQQIIQESLEQDREIAAVEAGGPTLEEAVAQGAALLDIPIRRMEYEVVERGFKGLFGKGQKNWKIRAYERVKAPKSQETEDAAYEEAFTVQSPVRTDKDGEVFVLLRPEGAFIKVTPPLGRGKKADENYALVLLRSRVVKDIDIPLLMNTMKEASGDYVRVGYFEQNPTNDAIIKVEVADMEMKASIFVSHPGPGGCDLSLESILSFLRQSNVTYGIKEEVLRDFVDHPIYMERILVAEGTKAVQGRDGYIQYNFEMDQAKIYLREGIDGKVDFKDLHIIKNVVQGQPLAKRIPPELGSAGKTVTGRIIPAQNGRDIVLPLGKNVYVGDDGATIFSEQNGQVVVINGKINVEPVYTVQGNVDIKTGNIIFLGTVVVKGSVESGFSVRAAGNIEVHGTVEKAELDAEGDIIVHQGITGQGAGIIRAGRSIWARFIENTVLEAGAMVVASDGIINSRVDAYKRIICQGKRAHIVGGRLRATEEINAKILGSPTSGTETVLEVGFDPRSKERIEELTETKNEIEKKIEEIQLNLQTLANIKKQQKSLQEEKEAYQLALIEERKNLLGSLKAANDEIGKAKDHLASLITRGRISASAKVYPGVKIIIRDAKQEVINDYRAVTFILEDGLVSVTKYEEPDAEIIRGPDGDTTD
ncbi:MAG: FapA family protein [Spirochaetaceae bacterium]|jgi:uncharacterized protein (DUF342 family)|nr:FapA family protein [Spirochaetaceae bacterium]